MSHTRACSCVDEQVICSVLMDRRAKITGKPELASGSRPPLMPDVVPRAAPLLPLPEDLEEGVRSPPPPAEAAADAAAAAAPPPPPPPPPPP
eukprot:COSAG05_NODE_1510_length_4685_cov_3.769298_1_plen_91_part_10